MRSINAQHFFRALRIGRPALRYARHKRRAAACRQCLPIMRACRRKPAQQRHAIRKALLPVAEHHPLRRNRDPLAVLKLARRQRERRTLRRMRLLAPKKIVGAHGKLRAAPCRLKCRLTGCVLRKDMLRGARRFHCLVQKISRLQIVSPQIAPHYRGYFDCSKRGGNDVPNAPQKARRLPSFLITKQVRPGPLPRWKALRPAGLPWLCLLP